MYMTVSLDLVSKNLKSLILSEYKFEKVKDIIMVSFWGFWEVSDYFKVGPYSLTLFDSTYVTLAKEDHSYYEDCMISLNFDDTRK